MLNLPNILTFTRIILIPAMVAAFYIPGDTGNLTAFWLFFVAAITDFLDGWLARIWDQQSRLGQFLDPVADKLLVASAIVMLIVVERIEGWLVFPALIILAREILVSGLREFLAELQVRVPVTELAKWKTTIQLVAIAFLILSDAGYAFLNSQFMGELLMWVAAILTIYTGYDYFRAGLKHLAEESDTQ